MPRAQQQERRLLEQWTTLPGAPWRPADLASPVAKSAVMPGTMVDHFEVIRLLGRGGMGEVHLARDTKLGRKVALKLIAPELLGSKEAAGRFLSEARTTAKFNHPHIVAIFAVGEHEGIPYVALEYLEGQNLRERIREQRPGLQETLRIALAIAEALAQAHRDGVLHCDLKPENVVIPRDGRVRVVDFGIAVTLRGHERAAARTGSAPAHARDAPSLAEGARAVVAGTPGYMAPEQWGSLAGNIDGADECAPLPGQALSGKTDVWALGVMLFELCTERSPFDADEGPMGICRAVCGADPAPRLSDLAGVPAELSALVARCLEKDPERRPEAIEVAEALHGILAGGRRSAASEESPFRGLFPFTERHADLFYGREAEIAAFLERVRVQPVLAVVGPSGAGKSSFVQAGVIPRLREQGRWTVLALRPGSRPFEAMAARLLRGDTLPSLAPTPAALPDGVERQTKLAEHLLEAPHRLSFELRAIASATGAKVLLFVDQLEELFTLVADERVRQKFMLALCTAADDPSDPVRVVFTARDDFLGRLATGPEPREVLTELTLVERLGPDALRDILLKPVQAAGYGYDDPQLVGLMVDALSAEPASLPLLQFAAQMLWDKRDRTRKLLLRSAYDQMGGVEGAVAKHADGVLAGASASELRVIRELVLRLVTPERTRKVQARARLLEGLGSKGEEVLSQLTRARLVAVVRSRGQSDAEATVELAHEALIRSWSTLSRWLDEGREEMIFLAEVGQAAELWQRRGCRPEELWQGDALQEALRALGRCSSVVPPHVTRFLDASRAKAARRVLRRRGFVAVVIGCLLAVAAVLETQRRASDRLREVADEQRSEAQRKRAEGQLEGTLSAMGRDDVLEARAKLRVALEIQDSPVARALFWQLSQNPLRFRKELGAQVTAVAYSPDGRTLIAVTTDKLIVLLDAVTGAPRAMLRGHNDTITSLDVSPDGRMLATASIDGEIRVWDIAKAAFDRVLRTKGPLYAVVFSPDGTRLATCGVDTHVRLWDVHSGQEKNALEGDGGTLRALAFSPDGRLLAAGGEQATVRLWDVATPTVKQAIKGAPGEISSLRFTADGGRLAAGIGSGNGGVVLWRMPSGEQERLFLGHKARVNSIGFSPDGKQIVSGSQDSTVRLWDAETGAPKRVLEGHRATVWSVGFSPDGQEVVSSSRDRTLRVWNIDQPASPQAPEGHSGAVNQVRFSPDGHRVASTGHDGAVRLWDVRSGNVLQVFQGYGAAAQYGLSFHPEGRLLATAGQDRTIGIWDIPSGALQRALMGHRETIPDLAFSPNGRFMASASDDKTVLLWTTEDWTPRPVPSKTGIWSLRFSPDSALLAGGQDDGHVVLWGVPQADEKQRFPGHIEAVLGVSFSPDGRRLASGSDDGTVRVLDLRTGQGTQVDRIDGRVHSVAFHPDGRRIGTASSDGNARVIDLDTGTRRDLSGHRDEVNAIAFNADGTLAATSSDDETVRLWEVDSGKPFWRAPALLSSPPRLLSHLGWSILDSSPSKSEPSEPSTRALAAAGQDARFVSESRKGGKPLSLCIVQYDRTVQLWDLLKDERVAGQPAAALEDALAIPGGCVMRMSSGVDLLFPGGAVAHLPLQGKPTAIGFAPEPDQILVAAGHEVFVFDPSGTPRARYRAAAFATAIARSAGALVAGYRDGNIELLSPASGPVTPDSSVRGAGPAVVFAHVPSSPVVRLLEGPMNTLIAGYASGALGIWSQTDGARLAYARLHGPVVHLLLEGRKLYAATELGDSLVWDLGALYRDYCELLNEVWTQVPVVWEAGNVLAQPPPSDHPCYGK